jgi:hypothetical protein
MNDFQQPGTTPKWHFVVIGIIAAIAVDAIFFFTKDNPQNHQNSPLRYLIGPAAVFMIVGLGIAVSSAREKNIRLFQGRTREDLSPEEATQAAKNVSPIYKSILVFVGVLFFFMAGMGIYAGHISVGKHNPRIVYEAREPVLFWFNVIFYSAIGGFSIYTVFKKR